MMSESTQVSPEATQHDRPLLGALHLVTLGAFALAQPLFSVLQENATFLVAAEATRADLWLFAIALALVPGLALALSVFALQLVSARASGWLRTAWVSLLAALVVLPPLRRLLDSEGAWTIAPALALGLSAAWAYARWGAVRSFLDVLAPAPLVFVLLFMFGPGVARVTRPAELAGVEGANQGGGPSAVFVVLDELPMQSLMSPELTIDARLFPNFARLAATSTWFRNATASHENTERALPAIFSGQNPDDPELLPTAADHPRSVFTLLGESHRMRVWETFTSVCPAELLERGGGPAQEASSGARRVTLMRDAGVVLGHVLLPADLAGGFLPPIDRTWGGFAGGAAAPSEDAASVPDISEVETTELGLPGKQQAAHDERPAVVREFIASIDGAEEPTLYLVHVLLPHGPYVHLPSTASYDPNGLASGFPGGRMPEWPPIAEQQYARHLLQLAAVDTLLGELLDRLDETGLSERCALILLADHGVNFAAGEYARQVFKRNAREVAHVPFFVREPGQRAGRVDDRDVRTVDALPTLLDAMGIDSDWSFDGASALSQVPLERGPKQVFRRDLKPLTLKSDLPRTWRGLETRMRLFGPRPTHSDLYSTSPARTLIGRGLAGLVAGAHPRWSARLDRPERFVGVDPQAASVPVVVAGVLHAEGELPAPDEVIVAVDGVVRSSVACRLLRPGRARFTALVPEEVWTAGDHQLRLFARRGDGQLLELNLE